MATKNDVVGLAKTTKKPAAKKPAAKKTTRKPAAKKPAVKKLTAKEERDLKAKETVKELLKDSPIVTLEKKDDLLVLDETPTPEEPKGVEWLEEQVTLLNQKNEALTAELDVVKIENQTLKASGGSNDGNVSKLVVDLFNELQENFVKMGVDNRGIGNFRIYTPGFLNRMIKFFPFLEQHKRY